MYVVLVILIALWAVVLVPPYLKDRRASGRTFGAGTGSLPVLGAGQRFEGLQHTRPAVRSSVPASMRGPAVSPMVGAVGGPTATGPASLGSSTVTATGPSNVVPLHRVADDAAWLGPTGDESTLHDAWEPPRQNRVGVPTSTAAARERRRQVLLGLTGAAFVSLLLALAMRGSWIALHVAIDAALVGYVVLLVRCRQIASERRTKVEPIRPAVTEQPPVTIQAAPDYLVRSGT